MSKSLLDRIDERREYWGTQLEVCRDELLNTIKLQIPMARLVVELDYLLVEAKIALEASATKLSCNVDEMGILYEHLRKLGA